MAAAFEALGLAKRVFLFLFPPKRNCAELASRLDEHPFVRVPFEALLLNQSPELSWHFWPMAVALHEKVKHRSVNWPTALDGSAGGDFAHRRELARQTSATRGPHGRVNTALALV